MPAEPDQAENGVTCTGCAKRPAEYRHDDAGAMRLTCLRCFVRARLIVRRALSTSLVVGTVLTAINQGDVILQGDLNAAHLWKIPLTYLVPYVVTTWGALTAGRMR